MGCIAFLLAIGFIALAAIALATYWYIAVPAILLLLFLAMRGFARANQFCPDCTKRSPSAAKVCVHCGYRFDGEGHEKTPHADEA